MIKLKKKSCKRNLMKFKTVNNFIKNYVIQKIFNYKIQKIN